MADEGLFRVRKGTANFNAYRTLMFGAITCVLLLAVMTPLTMLYDKYVRQRPWVWAEMRVNRGAGSFVVVDSVTHTRARVSGERFIWLEATADSATLCAAVRTDSWEGDRQRAWTFEGFLEHRCDLPTVPFRICTEFSVRLDSGAAATFSRDPAGRRMCTTEIDPSVLAAS